MTAGWKRLIVDIAAVVLPGDRMVFGGDIPGALVHISAPERVPRVPDHVMPESGIPADKEYSGPPIRRRTEQQGWGARKAVSRGDLLAAI